MLWQAFALMGPPGHVRRSKGSYSAMCIAPSLTLPTTELRVSRKYGLIRWGKLLIWCFKFLNFDICKRSVVMAILLARLTKGQGFDEENFWVPFESSQPIAGKNFRPLKNFLIRISSSPFLFNSNNFLSASLKLTKESRRKRALFYNCYVLFCYIKIMSSVLLLNLIYLS